MSWSSSSLYPTLKAQSALGFAATTGNRTGEIIDTRGYDALSFIVQVGTVTTADATNKFTVDLYHGDLASGTDATPVEANERIGAAFDIDAVGDADKTGAFGYLGIKRYVHVRVAESGTASAIIGATALLTQPLHATSLLGPSGMLN